MKDSDLYDKLPFFHGDEIISGRDDSSSYPFRAERGSSRGIKGGDLHPSKVFKWDTPFRYKGEQYEVTSKNGNGTTMSIIVKGLDMEIKNFKVEGLSRRYPIQEALENAFKVGIIEHELLEKEQKAILTAKNETIQKGQEFTVKVEPVVVEVEPDIIVMDNSASIHDRYSQVVGNISELTKGINATNSLGELKDIAEAFKSTKKELEDLTDKVAVPSNSMFGAFGRTIMGKASKITYLKTWTKAYNDTKTESTSVQDNIDYLFGLIHTKYEKLVETGEALQKTKVNFQSQIGLLEDILKESEIEIAKYSNPADVPIRMTALNTQVATGVEKFRQRLLKIDGAIMATQHTIMVLGKELPALKTDLTDEMAIGSLLGSVDQYQQMYQEISGLVANITEKTAVQTHQAIENLMEIQINDTHAIKYIADSTERGKKFASMITDKSAQLADKIAKDAVMIKEVASGSSLLEAKAAIKQLGYKA